MATTWLGHGFTLALGLLGAVNDTATHLCTKPQKGGDM